MPYLVTVDSAQMQWPSICPFCETANATAWVQREYTRVTGYFLAFLTYRRSSYSIPACTPCATRTNRFFGVASLAIFGPLALLLLGIFAAPTFSSNPVIFFVCILSIAAGVVLHMYRAWFLRRLRLGYLRDSTAIFVARSFPYATALAAANATQVQRRLFLFRIR